MKRAYYIALLVLFCHISNGYSQNIDDALRFNQYEITGTARSISMANAFGSLGGDLSAISINPAAIAVYRSSEFSFTPGINYNKSNANFQNLNRSDDKYSFSLNQIGGVSTYKPLRENEKGLISTHFGFNYTRTANFNRNTGISLRNNVKDVYDGGLIKEANTLLTNIYLEANGTLPQNLSGRAKWAYETYLIDALEEGSDQYLTAYEGIDENSGEIFPRNIHGVNQQKNIETSGYAGEYALTYGANISNRFLLGGSLNFQALHYNERSAFREINHNGLDPAYVTDLDYYDSYLDLSQDGFGLNAKLGAIFNFHPIRFGVSFHTPTFYNMKESYYEGIDAYYQDREVFKDRSATNNFKYNYRTPYRAEAGVAFIIGKMGLISVDYELTDHTSSKFKSKGGYDTHFDKLNKQISEQFKVTHNFRAGIEVKPISYLAIRGGFAYYDSPIKEEYVNNKPSHMIYSGGVGYRAKNFFLDMAYSYKDQSRDFFVEEPGLSFIDPVTLDNSTSQFAMTFGWKF
ncbi:MAG: hypothetical protein JEZ14_04440 [Marinilabiliaceae bacterium]|nr:hypothetical protein [Marinilabiliaceae bacterium]